MIWPLLYFYSIICLPLPLLLSAPVTYFTFSSLEGLWLTADCLTHSTLCLKFTLCLCFFLWCHSCLGTCWVSLPPGRFSGCHSLPRDGISSSLIFGSPVPSPMPGTLWGCWTNACWMNEPMNESQKWVQKGRTRTGKPVCQLYRVNLIWI